MCIFAEGSPKGPGGGPTMLFVFWPYTHFNYLAHTHTHTALVLSTKADDTIDLENDMVSSLHLEPQYVTFNSECNKPKLTVLNSYYGSCTQVYIEKMNVHQATQKINIKAVYSIWKHKQVLLINFRHANFIIRITSDRLCKCHDINSL